MTLPEIALGLDADVETRRPPRARDCGPTDPEAGARWIASLSLRQLLNVARYGHPDGE